MSTIINTLGLKTVNFINGKGEYRAIVKCKAGFLVVSDGKHMDDIANEFGPATILEGYKKGSLQTVQFKPEGFDHWLNVFALKGKKVILIDQAILQGLTVGAINSYFVNTELYSQKQYQAVNAKSWSSKAFVMNAA